VEGVAVDDVLVLGRVNVAAQRVGGGPEFGLKAEVSVGLALCGHDSSPLRRSVPDVGVCSVLLVRGWRQNRAVHLSSEGVGPALTVRRGNRASYRSARWAAISARISPIPTSGAESGNCGTEASSSMADFKASAATNT